MSIFILMTAILWMAPSCKDSEEDTSPNVPDFAIQTLSADLISLNPFTYDFEVFTNYTSGGIASVAWDFGDGTILANGSLNETHDYTSEGTYTVKVDVTAKDGKTDSYSRSLEIAAASLQFNPDVTFQTIRGWGGFGPAKVWWSQPPYYDADYLNDVVDDMGSTIIRTQIYWDGEPSNDNDDPMVADMSGFDFGPDSDNGKQFPFIEELGNRGVKLMSTVWTPPVWMKDFSNPDYLPDECYNCNCPVSTPYPPQRQMCGGELKQEYYDEFAEYLATYVKVVKQETGVDVWAINIQNEPQFPNPFEASLLFAEEYAEVLKVVGERFEAEGLPTLLFGPEHMGEYFWNPGNQDYVRELLQDATVKPHLDFYAVHSYVDGVTPDYGSAEGWVNLHNAITEDHGKELWMTETSSGSQEGWDLAKDMSRSLYLALKFGEISGWVYWYFADVVWENGQLTKLGHAFKNYYKYVRPGAVMIEANPSDSDILTVSFKHPANGTYTHVLINNTGESTSFRVPEAHGVNSYDVITTSENKNTEVEEQVAAGDYFVLPVDGIVTLYSN